MTETGGTAGLALVRVSFHSLALLLLYFRLSFRVLVHFAFFPGVALVSDSAPCISHFPSTHANLFFLFSCLRHTSMMKHHFMTGDKWDQQNVVFFCCIIISLCYHPLSC